MGSNHRLKSTIDGKRFAIIVERLNHLHSIKHMSWREIALEPDFMGIPQSTLNHISKGNIPMDNRIRSILGLSLVEIKVHYKNHKPKKIQDMSVEELLWCLENRKDI